MLWKRGCVLLAFRYVALALALRVVAPWPWGSWHC